MQKSEKKTCVNQDSLACVVVGNSKETDNTGPGASNLPGEFADRVLSVSSVTEETAQHGNADSVGENDGVVLVLLELVSSLLSSLLGLLLLVLGLLLQLLGAISGLGLELVLALLSVGLDGLRLVVRGHRGNVGAVDIDKALDVVLSVDNLWRGRSAPVEEREREDISRGFNGAGGYIMKKILRSNLLL